MLTATGSRISHSGERVEATTIAPVTVHGQIVVPQGSKLIGSVAQAAALGLGLKHLTASLAYSWHTLQFPGGPAIPLNAQLLEVETAKEEVDGSGITHGIHPIASLSSSLAFYTVPILFFDPVIGIPIWAIKSLIVPVASPEILFPAGTELILRLSAPVAIPAPNSGFPIPTQPLSPADLSGLAPLLKSSAQRAQMGKRPSDFVNVLLIGGRSQIDRAFHASGWSRAQRKSPLSLYRMYHAISKRHGYARAPMNALTLNGVPSAFVEQKSLDTVQKRHHVRFWQYPGKDIWLGAAAEDVKFRFKWAHWTHSTDPHIDSERAKVVNDLAFTSCVSSAGLIPRTSTDLAQDPKAEYPIVTDRDIAVIRLNDCTNPRVMAGVINTSVSPQRGRWARSFGAFRDDLVRSNIAFTAYNTVRFFAKRPAASPNKHAPLPNDAPRGLDWLPRVDQAGLAAPLTLPDSAPGRRVH